MVLSIKSDEADRLARQLAATTGESLTEAVVVALRDRLRHEQVRREARIRTRLARLQADVAVFPVLDQRPADEIVGYDAAGLPA